MSGFRFPSLRVDLRDPREFVMQCEKCRTNAVIHIADACDRTVVEEAHLCEEHARSFLRDHAPPVSSANRDWPPAERSSGIVEAAAVIGITPTPAGPASRPGAGEVLMDVNRLVISEIHEHQTVVLREVGGERCFSCAIGIFEATNLDRRLKRLPTPRPLTHDAWADSIVACGGQVRDVVIHDLQDHTYYALIRIRQDGRLVTVDARPSDAWAIALVCEVPILVAASVLAQLA